jgi:hypothetical protein
LPCARFYLKGLQQPYPSPAIQHVCGLLHTEEVDKLCMLRTQEPLVLSETDSHRSFTCTVARDLAVVIGVLAEGRQTLGALPKRFQVPKRLECLRVIKVQAKQNDVISLSASPSIRYHVAKAAESAKTRGEVRFYRNNTPLLLDEVEPIEGLPLRHEYTVLDGICGIIFWIGGLSDITES